MNTRALLLMVGLAGSCSLVLAQPPQANMPPPSIGIPRESAEPSIAQLLDELERLRTHKAQIEKKELELKAVLRQKLQKQADRLKQLGVEPASPMPGRVGRIHIEDRVGRIHIEGNHKTSDQTFLDILAQVEIYPEAVLRYPSLEEARARLIKAGWTDATVEAKAMDSDTDFKDIFIRVNEAQRPPLPMTKANPR